MIQVVLLVQVIVLIVYLVNQIAPINISHQHYSHVLKAALRDIMHLDIHV